MFYEDRERNHASSVKAQAHLSAFTVGIMGDARSCRT